MKQIKNARLPIIEILTGIVLLATVIQVVGRNKDITEAKHLKYAELYKTYPEISRVIKNIEKGCLSAEDTRDISKKCLFSHRIQSKDSLLEIQKIAYPVLRTEYAKLLSDTEKYIDMTIDTAGEHNEILRISGKNIYELQYGFANEIRDNRIKNLRFKTVQYLVNGQVIEAIKIKSSDDFEI